MSELALTPRSTMWMLLAALLTALSACGTWSDTRHAGYAPGRLPMGPLTIGVWLPAGLDELRFAKPDQQLLLDVGINFVEWLQPARDDGATPEQLAMRFCSQNGLRMPVYYPPPGFSPYDKLHNWATKKRVEASFDEQVRQRVRGLLRQWGDSPGFGGYLVGHEDYSRSYYPALRRTVELLREEDPRRPAFAVGRLAGYAAPEQFLDALLTANGPPNIFQHEHYVFRADVPADGRALQRQLDRLVRGYDQVARRLHHRNGRWHAIVQVHRESRHDESGGLYYRKPSANEIRVQAGLALTRGATGVIYFLYSSGREEVLDGSGEIVQRRQYKGLVDRHGNPTPEYYAVRDLNELLGQVSDNLTGRYFLGGFPASNLRGNPAVHHAAGEAEFGLFGDESGPQMLLIVNRRPARGQRLDLGMHIPRAEDALNGEVLTPTEGRFTIQLEPAGWRLLSLPAVPDAPSGADGAR